MWPNPQESADLVAFTEEMLNGKLPFLCSVKVLNTVLLQQLLKNNDVKLENKSTSWTLRRCGKICLKILYTNMWCAVLFGTIRTI